MTAVIVDARGMKCPWPALRLARVAREQGGQGIVTVLADDPIAPAELAKLCAERGWRLERGVDDPNSFKVELIQT